MTSIFIRCHVPIDPPITLSAKPTSFYKKIEWSLVSGDKIAARLIVPQEDIAEIASGFEAGFEGISVLDPGGIAAYADFGEASDLESRKDYWVNAPVKHLEIVLELMNVPDDDVARLFGEHSTAEKFVSDGKERQEASELGRRVISEIVGATNALIRLIRTQLGQFWLLLIEPGDSIQNFLFQVRAEWRRDEREDWSTLYVSPPQVRFQLIKGAADLYMKSDDWDRIEQWLTDASKENLGFALIADARKAFGEGQQQLGIIYLNSALEWGVQRFLESELQRSLPVKTLREVQKQDYSRLLENWVLPLAEARNLGITDEEWQHVRKVQKLRRGAGHPHSSGQDHHVTFVEFEEHCRCALSVLGRITGDPLPKLPPRPSTDLSAGSVFE